MADTLIVLLHGVGSRGADMAGLGALWRDTLPGARCVAPDAPFPFDHDPGRRQWFSVTGVTEANRPTRVVAARQAFDATLQAVLEREGFAQHLDRVVLLGFSQGSIMALDAVVSGRWPVAAVVAFAGRLASPEPFAQGFASPLCLLHGAADPVMPVALAQDALARIGQAGGRAQLHVLPGLGHTISAEGAALAASFIQGVIR